jgi:hypothetical protein
MRMLGSSCQDCKQRFSVEYLKNLGGNSKMILKTDLWFLSLGQLTYWVSGLFGSMNPFI